MKPVLYSENQNTFTSHGIGALSDAISCTVREERNGTFELEMTYPVGGDHYEEIGISKIIKCKARPDGNDQLFRIYRITKPISGIVTINAEHISYQLSYIPCAPFTAGSVTAALAGLKSNAMVTCPFEFWTDKSTVANYKQDIPENIRLRLGGTSGSILDVYGGEFEFDNYTVKLYNNRGQNRGVTLRYGKNITDIQQEENIAATYTSIVAYWKNDESEVHTPVIDSPSAGDFPYKRVAVVDFSSDYEEAPSVATLTSRATSYMNANNFGVPKVNIKVSFVALYQTEEYKDIAPLERVWLCDTVNVQFEKLNVTATAKIVKTTYNVLLDRYDSIELGEARTNLSTRMAAQEQEVKQEIDNTKTELEKAIDVATEALTGQKGGYWKLNYNANGKPYEMLIMDHETEADSIVIWRYNASGWGVSTDGGTTYRMAATLNSTYGASINADYIVAGTMVANRIRGGVLQSSDSEQNPNFLLDLLYGTITAKRLSIITPNYTLTESGIVTSFGLRDPTGQTLYADYSYVRTVIGGGVIKVQLCNHIYDTDAETATVFAINATGTAHLTINTAVLGIAFDGPLSSYGYECDGDAQFGNGVIQNTTKFFGNIEYITDGGGNLYVYDGTTSGYGYTGIITDKDGNDHQFVNGICIDLA